MIFCWNDYKWFFAGMITNVPPAVDEMANLLLPVLLATSHSKSDHDDQVDNAEEIFPNSIYRNTIWDSNWSNWFIPT